MAKVFLCRSWGEANFYRCLGRCAGNGDNSVTDKKKVLLFNMRFFCFHIHENKKLIVTGYRGTETMDKVLLVILAYNEGKNIERVVDHIKKRFSGTGLCGGQ